jgi:predicted transposase/invertase (TIGR01784 family)
MAERELVSFDWAIKKLLRNKANFDILEGFLSELLKDEIKIIQILESETNKEHSNEKYNRVDLKVESEKNGIIIIEIQYDREIDFFSRILWASSFEANVFFQKTFASKVIAEHLDKGQAYGNIPKVISISILYFDIGEGEDYIYRGITSFKGIHDNKILQLETNQKEYYNLNRIFNVFPEYYLIRVNKFNQTAKDTLDEWIYFLKTAEIKDSFTAKGIKKAKKALDVLELNSEEKRIYDAYQENLHYQASMWESSYGVGKRDGIEEGIEKGKLAIAKSLLDILDIETIALKTGLSVTELQKLKDK